LEVGREGEAFQGNSRLNVTEEGRGTRCWVREKNGEGAG